MYHHRRRIVDKRNRNLTRTRFYETNQGDGFRSKPSHPGSDTELIPFLFLALALPITDQSLNQAIENRDTGKTIIRIREMVKEHGVRAVPAIADAIAAVEAVPEAQWFVTDRHRVFVASINAVSLIKLPK